MPAVNPGTVGLVDWFEFDEVSGNRTGAHAATVLTDTNTVGQDAAGVTGAAAAIVEANDEYLVAANTSVFAPGAGDFSAVLWVKTVASAAALSIDTFSNAAARPGIRWNLRSSDGFGSFSIADGTTLVSVGVTIGGFNDGGWHMIAATYDRDGNVTPYLDGVAKAGGSIATASGNIAAFFRALGIGSAYGTTWASWSADLFSWWSRVLTADEITWLYNAGAGRSYADLTAAAGNPVAIIQQQHWRSVWAGGVPVG